MSTDERSKRRAKLVCAMPYKEEEDECQPILKSRFGFFLIFLFQLIITTEVSSSKKVVPATHHEQREP